MAADDAAVVVTLRANLKDYEAALKSAVRSTERAATAAQTALSSVGKTGTSNVIQANFQKSSAAITNDARVMSYQLNDIFSGLASGQGIRAVQQQLGQIAQQLQGRTMKEGASLVSAALATMVNPLDLAVVGFGLLASVAAGYFSDSEKNAEKTTKKLQEQAAAIEELAKKYGVLLPELERMADLQRQAATQSEANEAQQKAVAGAYERSGKAIDGVAGDILKMLGMIQLLGQSSAQTDDLAKAFDNLDAKIKDHTASSEDAKKVVAGLDDIIANQSGVVVELAKAIRDKLVASYDELDRANQSAAKAIPIVTGGLADLTKALEKLVGVDPSGLLAIIDMIRRQLPDALGAAGGALSSFGTGLTTTWTEVGKSISSAADLIKKFEGFTATAKLDTDNKYRAGFGSDTFVDDMGRKQQVTKDTVVTFAQATQDLNRRIGEFQATILRQIGPDFWKSLSDQQQAALTSIAYNYGQLPPAIVKAIKSGDQGQVVKAIAGLSGDNGGINAKRRMQEASVYAQGGGFAAGEAQKQVEAQQDAVKSLAEWNVETERKIELQKKVAAINGQVWLSEAERAAQVEALRISEEKLAELRKEGVTVSAEQEAQIRSLAKAQADATVKSQEAAERQKNVVDRQKQNADEIKRMNEQMANVIGGGLSSFVDDLMAGKNAGEAFASAIQRIASQLADMFLQMLIIKPLMNALFGLGTGSFPAAPLLTGGGLYHGGGTVGLSGRHDGRKFSPALWAGAPRYASGGVAGLRPGEIPAILHRGEIVVPNARRLAGPSASSRPGDTILNNQKISISVDNSRAKLTEGQGTKLAEEMNKAVQVVIVKEMRPGGLLRQGRTS